MGCYNPYPWYFQPSIIGASITHPWGPEFHGAFLLVEGGGVVMEVHVSDVQVNVVASGKRRWAFWVGAKKSWSSF